MSDPFFKIRPSKRSNPEARTTLDTVHQHYLSKVKDTSEQVSSLKETYSNLMSSHKSEQNDIERYRIEQELKAIKIKLDATDEKGAVFDYYLQTGDLLFQYYDIQDRINRGADNVIHVADRARPGSVFEALENASKQDISGVKLQTHSNSYSNMKEHGGDTLRRDALLDQYLQRMDPHYNRPSMHSLNDTSFICDACGEDMKISINDATVSCPHCGFHKLILMDSDKPSYKDPPREISYYAYKRINHFNEWLAQFQAKESTEIPEEVFENIQGQIKKERIQPSSLNRSKIREILKKLKYNSYYEHVPHILSRLNGHTAPVMDRETEEKLRYLFKEIQPSFQKHCPAERSNFLSYSYVLYKLCELLDLDDFLHCFPLLKNRDKLYAQDKIWEKICRDLKWEFIRSI
uniref:Viral late gene transcription factor 3 zinc ribbon domain-containing protein n=1 Tax=viral metagenome TaxID=1070528 RepID=A0A6C0DJI9_9ZZZZ